MVSIAQTSVEPNFFDLISEKSMAFIEKTDFESFCGPTLKRINDYRKQNGLKPVVLNPDMVTFSQGYVAQLLENNVYEHSDLNKGVYTLENLYQSMGFGGFLSIDQEWCNELPELIFSSWKKSKGHNANMLNPGITQVGMSIQIKTKGKVGSYSYRLNAIFVGL
jgi:uncharacterized protein YkwD